MNSLLKFGIPLGLGVVAAYLNYMAGSAATEPSYFVQVKKDVDAGQFFTEDNLVKLALPGDPGSLKLAAVPWTDRAILFQRACPRDLKKGDLVLWRDANPPPAGYDLAPDERPVHLLLGRISSSLPREVDVGDQITFIAVPPGPRPEKGEAIKPEHIGPFRVLAVGGRLTRDPARKSTTEAKEITVALRLAEAGSKEFDELGNRLLAVRAAMEEGSPGIIAVIPSPAQQKFKKK